MPIERTTITKMVRRIVADQLFFTSDDVKDVNETFESMGADSFDKIEILVALEETFDISITDQQSEKLHTIQDAVDLVDRMVNS